MRWLLITALLSCSQMAPADEKDWQSLGEQLRLAIADNQVETFRSVLKSASLSLQQDYANLRCPAHEDFKGGSLLRAVAHYGAREVGQDIVFGLKGNSPDFRKLPAFLNIVEPDGLTLMDFLKSHTLELVDQVDIDDLPSTFQQLLKERLLGLSALLFDFRKIGAKFRCELEPSGCGSEHHEAMGRIFAVVKMYMDRGNP